MLNPFIVINVFQLSLEHPAGLEITNGQVSEIVLNSFFFLFFFSKLKMPHGKVEGNLLYKMKIFQRYLSLFSRHHGLITFCYPSK